MLPIPYRHSRVSGNPADVPYRPFRRPLYTVIPGLPTVIPA